MSGRVEQWKAAWESRDPDRVAALYGPGATHASGLVPHLYPEISGSVLHGVEQIREYARRGLARYTALRFEVLTVTESETRSVVEYRRHSNLDGANPKPVVELIEWNGPRIAAVRVFHA